MLSAEITPAWIPTRRARTMLRVSRQRVYQLEAEGKIVGKWIDGQWLWSLQSIVGRRAMLREEDGGRGG